MLEHSLFGDDQPDICFIIRDAKIKKSETAGDEAVMAFEAMLKENGVTGIKTVMTLSKLKSDYGPHSMKLKLLNTYDVFLVEAEISEHTYSLLGKVRCADSRDMGEFSTLLFYFSISFRSVSAHSKLTQLRRKQ